MNRFLELTKAAALTAAMAAPIAAMAADDYSNNKDSTAFAVQVGEIYSGNIETPDDVDVFRITTTKQAFLAPYTIGATTPMNVAVYNQSGAYVGSTASCSSVGYAIFTNNAALGNNNTISAIESVKWSGGDPGSPSLISTCSLPAGTYYFVVQSLGFGSGQFGGPGTYKFGVDYWDATYHLTIPPAPYHIMASDFLGNSIWHAWENNLNLGGYYFQLYGNDIFDRGVLRMSPGGTRNGTEAFNFGGDIDYLIINVTAAGLLTGSSSYSSGQNTDTYGYLRDVNGNILSQNDDTGNLNFQVSARVNPGIYYLEIRHYNRMGGTGSYNWTVSMTP